MGDAELHPSYRRNVVEIRRAEIYERVIAAVFADPTVAAELGQPIEIGLPTGGITDVVAAAGDEVTRLATSLLLDWYDGRYPDFPHRDRLAEYAHVAAPVTGPKGAGKIYLVATRCLDAPWVFHVCGVDLGPSGPDVDLLPHLR